VLTSDTSDARSVIAPYKAGRGCLEVLIPTPIAKVPSLASLASLPQNPRVERHIGFCQAFENKWDSVVFMTHEPLAELYRTCQTALVGLTRVSFPLVSLALPVRVGHCAAVRSHARTAVLFCPPHAISVAGLALAIYESRRRRLAPVGGKKRG
jgi:hypothetical protein